MKNNPIQDILSSIGISFPGNDLMQKYADEKPPLRAELYSADQMEQHGKILAGKHKIFTGRSSNALLKRLAENEELLLEVHQLLTDAVKANHRIIPAGEWLLDNFYLIQDQIQTGKKHLPKGYSEDLPRLLNGASEGLPRVYDIAIEIISHSDGRVDLKNLGSFVAAYQSETPLKLGELWAIPIMLRLSLIENLRRLSTQIAFSRINQNLAHYWAGEMITTSEKDPKNLILVIADMARSNPPMISSFVAELTRQLQGKGPALALPLNWIEQRLSETGQTGNELINAEIQKQAADQVSMSNSIGSLRFLGTMDWRDFVESLSIVEQILRKDIGGTYSAMDFPTRDSYRHVVENIARYSDLSEHEVANMAIRLAKTASVKHGENDRCAHVGYYLVGKGIKNIEKGIHLQLPFSESVQHFIRRAPLVFYSVLIIFITLLVAGALTLRAYVHNINGPLLAVIGILAILCASHLAVTIVNWLATLFIRPKLLPRMDFTEGILPAYKTLVVIPALLTSVQEIEHLAEAIEVYFLANKDDNLYFGLLTDFKDADAETTPEDLPLLTLAKEKTEDLNKKYSGEGADRFYLFHRPRKWNQRDKLWMGYERKRGKLTELNTLLREDAGASFMLIVGRQEQFPHIKYIITIDSDTQLPRDSAKSIIAAMAHPLNKALYNEKKQRVTEGYGILQPRVSLSLPGASNSYFARMHGNDLGIDPYTQTTSDVYQDLFDEGSFIGKGIYDIDIFRKGLDNRFPENRILSHDLLEGCIIRSGLLSDVQLYEEYPSRYSADVKRRHRWIRGDWQIANWSMPFLTGMNKRLQKNPLSGLSRFKIFDNLRRSLVPPALILLLLGGWTILHDSWFWTLTITGILLLPSLIIAARDILHKPKEILLKQHFKDSIESILNNLLQTIFTITCLPYEAYYTLDAIIRTNWRIHISHKNLLEWNPSANSQSKSRDHLVTMYRNMFITPFLALAGFIFLTFYSPIDIIVAGPILMLWIIAPAIAWFLSRPITRSQVNLSHRQIQFLRAISRKTFAYFENFVTKDDNWLPPDNYQEHPVERIAHRTSPTNIGFSLMANLAAVDLGYLHTRQFIDRTANTLNTMKIMARHKGHFYNWYDTLSLQPLPPHYISTVDSGNLAGHLLTLRQGILAMANQPVIGKQLFDGLNDTLQILSDEMENAVILQPFKNILALILHMEHFNLPEVKNHMDQLIVSTAKIVTEYPGNPLGDQLYWSKSLLLQCHSIRDEITIFTDYMQLHETPVIFSGLIKTDHVPSLVDFCNLETKVLNDLNPVNKDEITPAHNQWLTALISKIKKCSAIASQRLSALDELAAISLELSDMQYDFLYDKTQHLLSIGYNVEEHRKDPSSYDLLASEARFSTFIGISQGKLPQESWFALGRQLTNAGGDSVLLSWSGSMFEYLMPLLVMPTYDNTLLDRTYKTMVQRQIIYGTQFNVPWGISESGYNLVDTQLNLQYRAFGVPELGLKRGLSEDLVIAPYASMMALMVDPEEACKNLQKISSDGFEGRYGFYESIDYTPSRLPRGQSNVTIRSFMAHHQGMGLMALDYLLCDKPMQKRFESEPRFQASLLLLQERIPKATKFFSPPPDVADISVESGETEMRVIKNPDTLLPEVQLLSNGNYHVMITNAGGGYSRWKNIAVTRWREDTTRDNWGNFCFIRDMEKDICWSTGHQPTLKEGKNYEAVFSQGRAEFRRSDYDIETHTEIVVSPEDDVEIRRVHITNRSRKKRSIEITSYAEVVLTSAIADALHPAFSNLFVQTEIISHKHSILCTRRPRSAEEHAPWMFHLMKASTADIQQVSYETDRMKFIGRSNTIKNPQALDTHSPLSGTEGPVLDPIVSIQNRITIDPQESVTIDMVYGMGETREACEGLMEKYQDSSFIERAFELAWTHSQMVLRQINASEADAQLYARLAGSVIYVNPSLRAETGILTKNQKGQSGLWSYSISGDLPIVLLQISDMENISLVKQLVQAHAYWRLKGLVVDLVIWNEDYGGYRQVLQNQLLGLISAGVDKDVTERPGGIFVRISEQIAPEDRILIQSVARIVISDSKGSLLSQVMKRIPAKPAVPFLIPRPHTQPETIHPLLIPELNFNNGIGGFSKNGKEYIINTNNKQSTPLPWVNVLSNARFGTIISESGQSYTWFENAHEFRLTPWNNDPVSDAGGEVFYIRDEVSGQFWSPVSLPVCGKSNYISRHGFGYSIFEHEEDGIHTQMQVWVDVDEPVKYTRISIRNLSNRSRRISVTGYIEWVLGDLRSKTNMHICTEIDPATGAIIAKNPYNKEFNDRVCFFDVNNAERSFTCDRAEFIGRNGSLSHPDAMGRIRLSGKTGAALDPCGALQVTFDLIENQEHEVIFLLGTGIGGEEATRLVQRFKSPGAAVHTLLQIHHFWDNTLGCIRMETPDLSMDIIGNGWLMYQTLACRFNARSGFYQSGGAFGFRDQLQDAMAILHTKPQIVREHILLCASRQFTEGDVQHWWHPPSGRGVRTKCSDDYLWLVFVTCRYISFTGDMAILEETVPFLEGRPLNPDEESYYDLPNQSNNISSLFDHCVRAIQYGLKFGIHGLPLIGSGDWNDGMDKVGSQGKGESVWLGFFLYEILVSFSKLAIAHNENTIAANYINEANNIITHIEKNAWDGEWYRRAFFDDGTALGSSDNVECQIDSLSQSWSVLSGGGNPARSKIAMESAFNKLVRPEKSIIQVLDPPFDKADINPGYIKGYVPGVRENGGQYTHAAIWMVMAFAAMKNNQRTWELFSMINPVNHGDTPENIFIYKAEPYVVAADVYSVPQYSGRGGWTWYTGSAGWMYRLIIESILGINREGDTLRLDPCVPDEWNSYSANYRYLETNYHIRYISAKNEDEVRRLIIDGIEQKNNMINLVNDLGEHRIEFHYGTGR